MSDLAVYVQLHSAKNINSEGEWLEACMEQRILLRGLSHVGATLTFDDWVAHWSLLALNEPAVTQVRADYLTGCLLLFFYFCTVRF